jgi:hypothetical protein
LMDGTSCVAASQTMSVSMSKYPGTWMFRIPMISDRDISGASACVSPSTVLCRYHGADAENLKPNC